MSPIRRSGPPPQKAAPHNISSAAKSNRLHRPEDGYAAPSAAERHEAALLAELAELGYGITVPCLVCRRPLTSARSLRSHVGPTCSARAVK